MFAEWTYAVDSRWRIVFAECGESKCLRPARLRFTLPEASFVKRFFAPECVFDRLAISVFLASPVGQTACSAEGGLMLVEAVGKTPNSFEPVPERS